MVRSKDRFRPRADAGLLSRAVPDAWAEVQANTTGTWPTWGEIEAKFPVLGGHIERLRAAETKAA